MGTLLPIVSLVGGGLLALGGALFLLGLGPRLDFSQGRFVVDLLGLLVFGIVPLGVGLGGVWYGKRRLTQARQAVRAEHDTALERAIMHRIRAHPQGIALQDVVTATSFSRQEVEKKISNLYIDGVLDMEITEQGTLVYKPRAL